MSLAGAASGPASARKRRAAANAPSTGAALTGAGDAPAQLIGAGASARERRIGRGLRAARRVRRGEQPEDGRARAAHERLSAPASARLREGRLDLRAQRHGRL